MCESVGEAGWRFEYRMALRYTYTGFRSVQLLKKKTKQNLSGRGVRRVVWGCKCLPLQKQGVKASGPKSSGFLAKMKEFRDTCSVHWGESVSSAHHPFQCKLSNNNSFMLDGDPCPPQCYSTSTNVLRVRACVEALLVIWH